MEGYVNKRIRNYSIVILLVACVMFILLGFFSYVEGKKVQLQNFDEIGLHYSQFAENALLNIVESNKTYVDVIANNEFVINYTYKPYDLLMKYRTEVFIENILKNISDYMSVQVIPSKLPSLTLEISHNDEPIDNFYDLGNNFFEEESCFIGPISEIKGKQSFIIINPIYKDEEVIGQVQMVVDLTPFFTYFMQQSTFKSTGYMFIFNENANMIMYPDNSSLFMSVDRMVQFIKDHMVVNTSMSYEIENMRVYFHIESLTFSNGGGNNKIYFAFVQDSEELFSFNKKITRNTIVIIVGFVFIFACLMILYMKRNLYLIQRDNKKVVEESLDHEVRKQTEELRIMAESDSLTGLYNHGTIYRCIEEVIKNHNGKEPLSLMMLDVDYFKDVNDEYGHQVGDEVLVKIASLLKENIRDMDLAGRYGGEEFILLLRNIHLDKSYAIAERIRKAVLSTEFTSERIRLSISIGVAQWKDEDVATFIKSADKKLYASKNYGRNKTTF